jgi:hypothetical protein
LHLISDRRFAACSGRVRAPSPPQSTHLHGADGLRMLRNEAVPQMIATSVSGNANINGDRGCNMGADIV